MFMENKIIQLDEYRTLKEELRKELRDWPKPGFIEAGPCHGMRSNPCMGASWVASHGVMKLRERLTALGVAGRRQDPYIEYFQRIWERQRRRLPSKGYDQAIIRQVEVFAEALREVTQGLFGVW